MSGQQILQVSESAGVRFAVRLASAPDVQTLPPRELESLWRAYHGFMAQPAHPLGQLPGIPIVNRRGERIDRVLPHVREGQLSEFGEMQRIARALLAQVSAGEDVSASMEGRVSIHGSELSFHGPPVQTFRMSLAWLLAGKTGRAVRKCPECGRFFVRVRRQIYCRDECTDRATWRNYPAAKKRRARKRQYEKNGWTLGARKRRK